MLTFYELAPSPNSIKLRMALRFKGVDFDATAIDAMDRSVIREASGQDLTPAIKDKGIVLNDSEAIINFLDCNYEGPRLIPRERAGRKACDAWKARMDGELAQHWVAPFFFAIGRREDLDAGSVKAFGEALAKLDAEIGERASFHDDADMAVCDLRVAEWAIYALPGEGLLERLPLFHKFRKVYGVEAGSLPNLERFLAPWNERLA